MKKRFFFKLTSHLAVILLVLLLMPCKTFAQTYRVEYDAKSIAQAAKNAALATASEKIISDTLKSIKNKNATMASMAAVIHTMNVLYHNGRSNIKGFDADSKICKLIFDKVGQIIEIVPNIFVGTSKNPLAIMDSATDMTEILEAMGSLAALYQDVVANGKIDNPATDDYRNGRGDGYNFLNPAIRLDIAYSIYAKLCRIYFKLRTMQYNTSIKYTWRNILWHVDSKTYMTLFRVKDAYETTDANLKNLLVW